MSKSEVQLAQVIVVDNQPQQYLRFSETPKKENPRSLTLITGTPEAIEISRILRNESTPRPMTHELTSNLLKELGGKLDEVEIHHVHEGTYHAALSITQEDHQMRIDCRPSDGIALALRTGATIFVTENVWAEVRQGPEIE